MSKLVRLLWYTRPYGGAFVWLSLGSVIATFVGLLQPWPMKLLVDSVVGDVPLPNALSGGLRDALSSKQVLLAFVVVGGFVLFLLNSAIEIVTTWGWTVVGRRMTYDIAQKLLAA